MHHYTESGLPYVWLADGYRLGPEFELIRELIEARSRAGLTQAQFGERMGTQKTTIARRMA